MNVTGYIVRNARASEKTKGTRQMNDNFDGQEIVFISPEALRAIAEIRKRQQERNEVEKTMREVAEAAGIAIKAIMDAITAATEAFSAVWGVILDDLSDAFHQISEMWDEVKEIYYYDPADMTQQRWRAAEKRFSQVCMVRQRQFEWERANRSAEMRGYIKIGRSGQRTGPKKAKYH